MNSAGLNMLQRERLAQNQRRCCRQQLILVKRQDIGTVVCEPDTRAAPVGRSMYGIGVRGGKLCDGDATKALQRRDVAFQG
jgi:hypothetical protein